MLSIFWKPTGLLDVPKALKGMTKLLHPAQVTLNE
jgi:hypothetical protein